MIFFVDQAKFDLIFVNVTKRKQSIMGGQQKIQKNGSAKETFVGSNDFIVCRRFVLDVRQ